jgi:hypothetical protein
MIAFTWAWAVIMMSYSAWQTQVFEGNWNSLEKVQNTEIPAFAEFCDETPYKYLRPFALGPSQDSAGVVLDKNNLSVCPWPESNSGFRLFWVLTQIIFLVLLMFENFVSRSKFMSTGLLYMYSFTLMVTFSIDSYAAVSGSEECNDGFANTDFATVMSNNGITLECFPYNFNGMVCIDLLAIFLNFIVLRMWMTCDEKFGGNPYSSGGGGGGDSIPASDSDKLNYA